MKNLFIAVLAIGLFACGSNDADNADTTITKELTAEVVETSCGQCNFGMHGDGCSLAVKIDDATYYVDGVDLHDQGDPHEEYGMCNVVRKATVTGKLENGRFAATSYELLPAGE